MSTIRYCTKCGTLLQPEARFCANCGARAEDAATEANKREISGKGELTLAIENSVPFQNMLTSLLQRKDLQGFRYWRNRLYASRRFDAYEYLAHIVDASVASGVLSHLWWFESEIWECQESLSDIEPSGRPRLHMICETIETCLADALTAIEGFAAYDFQVNIEPSFDDALTDWALDKEQSAQLDQLRKACEAELAENPVTIQRLTEWYSPRRIGQAGAEEAITTVGIPTTDNLAEDVHLRCAEYLLLQLTTLRGCGDTTIAVRAENLAAICASRVSPDDIGYASLTNKSANSRVELPSFVPLTPLHGTISFTNDGIVSLGENASDDRSTAAPTVENADTDTEAAKVSSTIASADASGKSKTEIFHRSQPTILVPENSVPFQNMLKSLLQNKDGEGFRYWRDKLYANHRSDGYEYLARMIDACVATGVLSHLRSFDLAVHAYGGHLSSHVEASRLRRLQGICATIQTYLADALAAIEGFAACDFQVSIRPSFDEALTNWALDDQRSARLEEAQKACEAELAESPIRILSLSDWYSSRRIDEAGTEAAILAVGTPMNDGNSAEDVHLKCALEMLLQHLILRSRDDTAFALRAKNVFSMCACHVRPGNLNYDLIAEYSKKEEIPLPAFIPLTQLDGIISFTDTGIVTLGEDGGAERISTTPGADSICNASNEDIATTVPRVEHRSDSEGSKLLSPAAADELASSFSNLVGLSSIKQSLAEVRSLLSIAEDRRGAGLPSTRLSLHAVFAGNPGTGKTTVARLYARMLQSLGYLKRGHLVEVDRSQLIAEYLGQTASKTLGVLQSALGGVLFIDEAYALKQDKQDTYGQECIDTILKFIEDHRDEFVVILAGYKDQMGELVDSNPGFKSRFAQYLFFEDYTDEQLGTILTRMAQAEGLLVSDTDVALVVEELSRERVGKNFSNARAVRNLFEGAIRRQALRLAALKQAGTVLTKEQLMRLERSDFFDSETEQKGIEPLRELDALIGLAPVKKAVMEYGDLIKISKLRGQDPREVLQPYFVMLGNPGTGKTTVARLMGRIFKELGYLPSDQLIETDRQSLVGGYVGQTAIKTEAVLDRALGGTLFIDEAYSLVGQAVGEDFGKEVIETLLKFMEDNRGRLVVVAAGYDNEMRLFLNSNPGLRSRFTNVISFPNYTSTECAQIFTRMVASQKLVLAQGVSGAISTAFEKLLGAPNWSNARDVRTLLEFVMRCQAERLTSYPDPQINVIGLADLEAAVDRFQREKLAGAAP